MLGHSIQKDVTSSAAQTGIGFPSPSFDVNSVAAEYSDISTGLSSFLLQSFFGRLSLNYKNRYLLTGTMRADGSSKFISSNRYGYFPSVSAGWNLGEESWWKYPQTDVKFRASWGCTGNQGGIGSYAYQALAGGGYNYNGENGLGLTTAGNRDLKWEKAQQADIGVDLSFSEVRSHSQQMHLSKIPRTCFTKSQLLLHRVIPARYVISDQCVIKDLNLP